MARRKKPKEPLDRPEREYAWAIDSLVASDRLDRDLVLRVLNRAAELRGKHGDGIITAVLSSLRFAVSRVGAERATAIFQDPDLSSLVWRAGLPGHLASAYVPLLTREELATLFGDFRAYLVSNRPALLGSGLPDIPFTASLWLDSLAGRLYYIKLPELAGEVPGHRARKPESPASEPAPEDSLSRDQQDVLLPGLSAEEAEQLEGIRPKVLDLELEVFRQLEDALRRPDPYAAWTRCLSLMEEALSHDEAARCVRLDRLYAEPERRIRESMGMEHSPPLLQPRGALSSLIDIIGHCEVELLVGIMHEAKTSLLETARRFGMSSWREILGKSYFDTMDKPWRNDLDSILDRFLEDQAVAGGMNLGGGYRARVNEALESEFYQDFITKIRVKRRLAAAFEPQILSLVKSLYAHFEATGSLPQLAPTFQGQEPSHEECVFRLEGHFWMIRYQGQAVPLEDTRGLRYIAELLARQNIEIPVTELYAIVGRKFVHTGPGDAPALSISEAMQEGLSVTGFEAGDPVIDLETVADCERRLRELPSLIKAASARGDAKEESKLKVEEEGIRSELRRSRDRRARIRKAGGDIERIRKAVSNRIADGMSEIDEKHPSLGTHLRGAIRTGTICFYRPKKPVPWSL